MTLLAGKRKPLVLRDEIHGDITFDPLIRCVVDHEVFQRLRYIKQLGLAEYVFPCATHTRFQHSLGAAYLAGQYFDRMSESWLSSPFLFDGKLGETQFFGTRTWECFRAVADHGPSQLFWRRVVTLGGLLHDVGHGPWSHSFENLNLKQDFQVVIGRLEGAIRAYYDKRVAAGPLMHEDLSVLYIFSVLKEMEERGQVADHREYFPAVAALVNGKLVTPAVEAEIEAVLARRGYQGGTEMHRLLRPLISGPFDVDRMDYIQRDGRNCGVHIGGIEWPRIVAKLMPCLARHEKDQVVLVSHVKNQHVLDDFVFSLFQMYAQVYMHPKIVGLEESIRRVFEHGVAHGATESLEDLVITFDVHRSLTDEKFRAMLRDRFGVPDVDALLFRRPGGSFKIVSSPLDARVDEELRKSGFERLPAQDRPMLKDTLGVFLYSSASKELFLRPWFDVSPIARQFHAIRHEPQLWIRRDS